MVLSLICCKRFHFFDVPFLAVLHIFLPSEMHRDEGEKLGQQPSVHCSQTDVAVFELFSPQPLRVSSFYTLGQCLLTHLPHASSFHSLCFDLASSVYPHSLVGFVDALHCPTLLCSSSFPLFSPCNISGCWLEI